MHKALITGFLTSALAASVHAAGYRTVGSSGCAAQMVFVPPYTDTVVFLDNYHANYGGPGVNLTTGAHSPDPYLQDDGSGMYVFGVEYSWRTNDLRKLTPKSNTFCAAGAFFPDGTMINVAGAEIYGDGAAVGSLEDGRQSLRRYAPGPCSGNCTMDFVVNDDGLQSLRWYPTAITMANGDVLVVGGSTVGGLVTNEASINNPTYEFIKADGSTPPTQAPLEILNFTAAQNDNGNYSYQLYPILQLLPNSNGTSQVFTLAGNRAIVFDYENNELVKTLPDVPLEPRCFPSSATAVLLPLQAPDFKPTILVCGGSSTDAPNPQALDDCYRISPTDGDPVWEQDDNLPNGPQTMTDGVLLPDGQVLLLNGAHKGSGGGYMADDPVTNALLYNPAAGKGSRFTSLPGSDIPRLYHSVAVLLPSGEVIVAGSNPQVFYTVYGNVSINGAYPEFYNNGHLSFLDQQQDADSNYPTEYRVEIFSPPYMDSESRPSITSVPDTITYGSNFQVTAEDTGSGTVVARLIYSGFHTHAIDMGSRNVELQSTSSNGTINITAPTNSTVMAPGVYLLFIAADGIPSEGQWIQLE
ncbi:hypothetical protein MBLNU459_g0139t1 [Dothideomycetes sp. NU459]